MDYISMIRQGNPAAVLSGNGYFYVLVDFRFQPSAKKAERQKWGRQEPDDFGVFADWRLLVEIRRLPPLARFGLTAEVPFF